MLYENDKNNKDNNIFKESKNEYENEYCDLKNKDFNGMEFLNQNE